MWAPVHVLVAILTVVPCLWPGVGGKAVEDDPGTWGHAPAWETVGETAGFGETHLQPLGHLDLSVSSSVCVSAFLI